MSFNDEDVQILIDAREKLMEVLKNGQQALEIVNKKVEEAVLEELKGEKNGR